MTGLDAALERLAKIERLSYSDLLETHKILFEAVYPWAGQDRLRTAPDLAISRGPALFAHPEGIQRAANYALTDANDKSWRIRLNWGRDRIGCGLIAPKWSAVTGLCVTDLPGAASAIRGEDEETIGGAGDAVHATGASEMNALDHLVETVPSTPVGLFAMIDYVVGYYAGEITPSRWRHDLLRDDEMVVIFLTTIRESVAALMAEAAWSRFLSLSRYACACCELDPVRRH
jgi:hypothetical protein